MNHSLYEGLIRKFTAWGQANPDIKVMLVVGSRARKIKPADPYSDLDLVLFAENPTLYLSSTDWIHHIGPYQITFTEKTATSGGRERRILFNDGLDVDVSVFNTKQLKDMLQDPSSCRVLARGFNILLNKNDLLPNSLDLFVEKHILPLPSKEEYINEINDFWYHVVLVSKKMLRKECWESIMIVNSYLKKKLLTMIEWYTLCKYGQDTDVWFQGRFIDSWVERQILDDLPNCFAHYSLEDILNALYGTMQLYRRISKFVSDKMHLPYSIMADSYATKWVQDHFS